MKGFIRQRLLEAIKSRHWKMDSYPVRVSDVVDQIGEDGKKEVDEKIKFIESLEFGDNGDKIGIWVYKSPAEIKHQPFKRRDKGSLLLVIMNDNTMTTLYWKHKREGEYDFDISIEDLLRMSKTKFYDAKTKPITIKSIKAWLNSNKPEPHKRERFKKIKLTNGVIVKYYADFNKFETLEGEPIKVDDIFDSLPGELQDKVMELLENRK